MNELWLVTGSAGQLGRALSAELEKRKINFVALNSDKLDITNLLQCYRVINSLCPRVIVNTAAWTDVDAAETKHESAFLVNETGVANLVSAASKINSIFVHLSTDFVFSGESNKPWSEDSPINPQNVYGKSKAAGEMMVSRSYAQSSYIVRTSWLYSEYGSNFAKTMCKLALSTNEQVNVVSDQIGQPTNAHELSNQLIDLVTLKSSFGTYHGTNCGEASWYDFAREIFRLCGADENRVTSITSVDSPRPAKRPRYSALAHNAWNETKVSAMRDWKSALSSAIPSIIKSVID